MSYNPKQLFSQIQKKEQDNASGSGNNSGFTNPLIFKPKVGSSYAVRLLWLSPDKGCDREYPMINSFIHRVWDDNATTGSKDVKVICPTSQYMMGETSAAFRRCPICEAASAEAIPEAATNSPLSIMSKLVECIIPPACV